MELFWTPAEHVVGDAHQCHYYILVWFASADRKGLSCCQNLLSCSIQNYIGLKSLLANLEGFMFFNLIRDSVIGLA